MLRKLFCAAGLALIAAPAAAETPEITTGITAGTLGVGPEVGVRLGPKVGVRANAMVGGTGIVDIDAQSDDIPFDGAVRSRSVGAMLDFYPANNGFRVSAGFRINGNKATLRATPTTNTTIGPRSVTPMQVGTLRASYRVRDWAPTLTVGYSGEIAPKLSLGVEAGAVYHGAPKITSLTSSGGSLSGDAGFAADLETERMLIQNDISDYKFYPVAQVSLAYRF
ncbi:hypothetical protein ACFOMD_08690 [Sphingoaurantiacus capsulatus]|uniref:Outer membrane protein beta-barrel domain-containing protein n=1 Tax=Sphingoaurantiacus capsulatus TaxID=1771310 RepID=A0ABV7X923_9SPHN